MYIVRRVVPKVVVKSQFMSRILLKKVLTLPAGACNHFILFLRDPGR